MRKWGLTLFMVVETQFVQFPSVPLDSGATVAPVDVAYETHGRLNEKKTNAILILHAFSGDAHAAGVSHEGKPGWWDNMIGPGKAFDTDRYFVLCSNCLGGCRGTTGPSSINPATGRPYAMSFPVVTISPPFLYGPGTPYYREAFFWDRLRDGRPVILPGDGRRLMQFVYIKDLVSA